MRFWDSSAVVPLIVSENASAWARRALRSDSHGLIWALTPVEVRSALARRLRDGALTQSKYQRACSRADRLFQALPQIVALEPVCARALRLLDTHPMRAADALQLAAALVATEERPADLPFMTLDHRLADAARKEGFPVEIAS